MATRAIKRRPHPIGVTHALARRVFLPTVSGLRQPRGQEGHLPIDRHAIKSYADRRRSDAPGCGE